MYNEELTPRSLALLLLLVSASCGAPGGPKTVTKDGYRAILAFSPEERFSIAVRGENRRLEGLIDGSQLVKILRPDLRKTWQLRPATKKILETAWSATEEIVPGYPLEPNFDPAAYADRFGGEIRRIADGAHGLHPCDRYELKLPSGDSATIWVARDLERLVVRIEHAKRDPQDEYQPFTDTQLLDVRVGAPGKLFEPPKGLQPVSSYEELGRG